MKPFPFIFASVAFLMFVLAVPGVQAQLVPLKTDLPKPLFVGTQVPVKVANLEAPRQGPRPPFMIPAGCVNLAKGKPVTSSDSEPTTGDLSQITDGVKAGDEGNYVELDKGKQWVQIDLGAPDTIYAILVSDDPDFIDKVTTVFNNDQDNAIGLGAGKDPAYIETYEGRLIDAKGVKGRYVRLYSRGNTTNENNHYIEVEVWGKPS
jgi:hypothetical protein